MKFSLSWIREFVEVTESPAELARKLTSAGLPVETIGESPDGDTVFDIEIFPNRPDCMSIFGIAREVAAATGRKLAPLTGSKEAASPQTGAPPATAPAKVIVESPELCGRYSACVLQDVKVSSSPDWLARRLIGVGLRPVNNIVDATNYVLWELGHPLHAFDHATLAGHEIRVRRARKGEPITTLDGVARLLDSDMLAIADAQRAVAIAGVMGGAGTMVSDKTTTLLIESAHFDSTSVRRTSKKLSLSTDASYRFERGADIEATVMALNRAAGLILQVAGGAANGPTIDVRYAPAQNRRLTLRPARVEMLLGMAVTPAAIRSALEALQFSATARGDLIDVLIPSHRQDIEREVDLIEEVARHLGYENVPERLPHIAGVGGVDRAGHRREGAIRRALESAGLHEAVTSSFGATALDQALRQRPDKDAAIEPVRLSHPIAADLDILRTTLLPGLLGVVAHNANRARRDVRLYEIGRVFRHDDTATRPAEPVPQGHQPHPVRETLSLGIAMTGLARPASWIEPPRETTFYDMKGLIESALEEAGLEAAFSTLESSDALDPQRCAMVLCRTTGEDWRPAGGFGAVTGEWRERFDIRQEVFVAEIPLDLLFALPERDMSFIALPRFPSVSRDLSLIVGAQRSYRELEETIRAVAPDRIASISLFDSYRGAALPAGTVGLSINVVYQHPDRTLASEEVSQLQERILESLKSRLGVRLRESSTTGGS